MSVSNLIWAKNSAEVFARLGIKHVCISPGSRNSPLTLAFIENKQLTCHSIIDERSNGFFALGIAKTSQNPVVIITTSGTGTANLYPAIIEANLSRVPLIILTADRPPHLVGSGENQTIDQQDLYGHHVRGFVDLGLPHYLERLLLVLKKSYLLAMGLSYYGKQINPAGPVHLNFPFDEPLLLKEDLSENFQINKSMYDRLQINPIDVEISTEKIPKFLLESFLNTNNMLFICGEGLMDEEKLHLINLAEKWNSPIFTDVLSNIRFGYDSQNIFSHYEFFITEIPNPDIIIRFGKKPNSKILNEYLNEHRDKVVLLESIGRFNDDVSQVHSYSVMQIPIQKKTNSDNQFINKILLEENYFKKKLKENSNNISEKEIAQFCFQKLPENSNWFIGNSLPIRNVDKFVSSNPKNVFLVGNRGASGIDGIISSALGMAILHPQKTNVLSIGDVSFFHDLSALQIAKQYDISLTIIVINNSGGQIFNKLPYADFEIKNFDKFWITNPNVNFRKTTELFGFGYQLIENMKQLEKLKLGRKEIVEVKV